MSEIIAGSGIIGCTGSCEASTAISGAPVANQALAVLSGIIGTYAFIEQIKLQRRMADLAKKASNTADEFYALSKAKYNTVDLPTWQRMNALYTRYTTFFGKEDSFLSCAFALKEYCPDTDGQAARAVTRTNNFFARADSQRVRMSGIACAQTSCAHTRYTAAMRALIASSSASAALQHEERFKVEMDRWFWERWQDGAKFVLALGDRAVKAIIAGAENVSTGLNGVANAVGAVQQAANGQASAIANSAQFWGNLASGGLNGFGQAVGAGYFNSAPSSGWTTTVTPTASVPSGYVGFK